MSPVSHAAPVLLISLLLLIGGLSAGRALQVSSSDR